MTNPRILTPFQLQAATRIVAKEVNLHAARLVLLDEGQHSGAFFTNRLNCLIGYDPEKRVAVLEDGAMVIITPRQAFRRDGGTWVRVEV